MTPIELLTPADVADVLGVSRQRVGQLRARADFPDPFAITRRGHSLWRLDDVERFADTDWRRAPGRPARAVAHA